MNPKTTNIPDNIKAILRALKSPDPEIRLSSVLELAESDYVHKYLVLRKVCQDESSQRVRHEIEKALKKADHFDDSRKKRILQQLTEEQKRILRALQSDDVRVLKKVFRYILKHRKTEFIKNMLEVESRFEESFFKLCNIRLLILSKDKGIRFLQKYLSSEDTDVVHSTLDALGAIATPKSAFKVLEYGERCSGISSKRAWKVLEKLPVALKKSLFSGLVNSSFPSHRQSAAFALRHVSFPERMNLVETLIGDENHEVTETAWSTVDFLADAGEMEAVNLLQGIGQKSGSQKELRRKRQEFYKDSQELEFDELLLQLKQSSEPRNTASLIQRIGFVNTEDQHRKVSVLLSYFESPDNRVRANAVEALGCCDLDDNALASIKKTLQDPNNRVVGNAILALSEHPGFQSRYCEAVKCALRRLIDSGETNSGLTVLFCIEHMLEESFLQFVFELARREDHLVRDRAHQLMETWSLNSLNVKNEVEHWKNTESINYEDEDEWDEFID